MKSGNDNRPDAILDTLLTPEQIANRINKSAGADVSARAIWDKAKRLGLSIKIGRTPMISAESIPALLQQEKRKWQTSSDEESSTTTISPMRQVSSGSEALALLQKSRRKRMQMRG